jgi:hypothetical protein
MKEHISICCMSSLEAYATFKVCLADLSSGQANVKTQRWQFPLTGIGGFVYSGVTCPHRRCAQSGHPNVGRFHP